MGMLQFAGAVSGFWKGVQQGLERTQNYMTQSMIQKLLTPEEMAPIEQRLRSYGNQIKQLTGGEMNLRKPFVDPLACIAEVDKWRGTGPLKPKATGSL